MNKEKIYNVPKDISEHSNVSESEFQVLYKQSVENPDEFWSSQAESYLDWDKKWEEVKNTNIEKGEIAWFSGGKLNASVNCIDRHLPKDKNKIAFI